MNPRGASRATLYVVAAVVLFVLAAAGAAATVAVWGDDDRDASIETLRTGLVDEVRAAETELLAAFDAVVSSNGLDTTPVLTRARDAASDVVGTPVPPDDGSSEATRIRELAAAQQTWLVELARFVAVPLDADADAASVVAEAHDRLVVALDAVAEPFSAADGVRVEDFLATVVERADGRRQRDAATAAGLVEASEATAALEDLRTGLDADLAALDDIVDDVRSAELAALRTDRDELDDAADELAGRAADAFALVDTAAARSVPTPLVAETRALVAEARTVAGSLEAGADVLDDLRCRRPDPDDEDDDGPERGGDGDDGEPPPERTSSTTTSSTTTAAPEPCPLVGATPAFTAWEANLLDLVDRYRAAVDEWDAAYRAAVVEAWS